MIVLAKGRYPDTALVLNKINVLFKGYIFVLDRNTNVTCYYMGNSVTVHLTINFMTRALLLMFLVVNGLFSFSQCIDKDKITYGGDWGDTEYIHRCPTYSFAYGGDTSQNWNVLTDPIDIFQAPKSVRQLKPYLDSKIKEYAGDKFFSKVRFNEVEVVYPNRLKAFLDSGRQNVTLKYCKAKYLFYYDFMPDSLMPYHIGIAVSPAGKIISKFNFPSKKDYKAIDTTFTYCQLIDIANKVKPDIEPIEEIQFQFHDNTKRFYWLVIAKIKNEKQGLNYFYQVEVDASDLKKAKLIRAKTYIDY